MKDLMQLQSTSILPQQLDVLKLTNYCFDEDEGVFFTSPPHGNLPKPNRKVI